MSSSAIQYISPLGQICKEQALAQLATGDHLSSGQLVTHATVGAVPGPTLNARRGQITFTTLGAVIPINGSVQFTLTNSHIKSTSIVLAGWSAVTFTLATMCPAVAVTSVSNGSCVVTLSNGGSADIAAGNIAKVWFIVLDL